MPSGSPAEDPPGSCGRQQLRKCVDFILSRNVPGNHWWIKCFRTESHASTPRLGVALRQSRRSDSRWIRDFEVNTALSGGQARKKDVVQRYVARQKGPDSVFCLFQYRIIRASRAVALELFPDGCHTLAVALAASALIPLSGHGSGRIKEQPRRLVGTEKSRFLLLVQMVGAFPATS